MPKADDEPQPQILLILVGLPGSGKTTFAETLVSLSADDDANGEHFNVQSTQRRRWIRASQDDAPNRRRQECEAVVRKGLTEGCNVVVDRVGFDAVQRSHFIQIARQQQTAPRIYCLILETSYSTLVSRLSLRPTHPTLPDPETALRVLGQMERSYFPPRNGGEGIDKILVLKEEEQGSGQWTSGKVDEVLERIWVEGTADPRKESGWRDGPDLRQGGNSGYGYEQPRGYTGRGGFDHRYGGRGGYTNNPQRYGQPNGGNRGGYTSGSYPAYSQPRSYHGGGTTGAGNAGYRPPSSMGAYRGQGDYLPQQTSSSTTGSNGSRTGNPLEARLSVANGAITQSNSNPLYPATSI